MGMVYVGTVGTGKAGASVTGYGMGVYSFYLEGDTLTEVGVVEAENAGIICASPDGSHIYAANETRDFDGGLPGSGGGVTAFAVTSDGTLKKVGESLSYGSRPSNVAVSDDGRFLLVANHGSHSAVVCRYVEDGQGGWRLERGFDDASVACFSITEDGYIGELRDLKVLTGSGYWNLGGGQSTSHVHCVRVGAGNLVYACDRGADAIQVMRLTDDGHLEPLFCQKAHRGYAPRHMAIDRKRSIAYVCNENYPCVTVYALNTDTGTMSELQTVGTMPESYYDERPLPTFEREHCEPGESNTSCLGDPGAAAPADVRLSHNGRFLYVSSRYLRQGRGSITSFAVADDGTLTKTGVWDLDGRDPRGITTSPSDHRLLVGLLDRDEILMLRADEESGAIVEELSRASCPSPASFVWA